MNKTPPYTDATSRSALRRLDDHVRLIRLQAAGFEGFLFTIGALLTGSALTAPEICGLWLLGVLINSYIFALNNFVDLPRDRQNTARASSPLVSGSISPNTALILSMAFPILGMAVIGALGWPPIAIAAFAFFLILGAVVNVYQKLTERPILMDSLFALTMAAPIPVTAMATVDGLPSIVWIATAFLFFLALELNSVAGNLKDLASDSVTGFRTVAVVLGATMTREGYLRPGTRYRRYCIALHGVTTMIGLVGIAGSVRAVSWMNVAVIVACVIICAAGVWSLHRVLAGRRRPSARGRELYFAAGFAIMLVIIALNAEPTSFLYAVGALLLWELVFGIGRRRRTLDRRAVTR